MASRRVVRQRVDQTIGTRNFEARNERLERGVSVKSGETPARKEKLENAFNGRRTDSVQEEILVVLTTGLILCNGHNHPLLRQEHRHRLTEESLHI